MRTVVVIVLLFLVGGCFLDHGIVGPGKDDNLLYPRVTLGQTDYTEQMVSSNVPDSVMFPKFHERYAGEYSDSLKNALTTWAGARVAELGGDRAAMERCMEATGQLAAGAVRLPMVVEQAKYQGKPCWVFQFIWGVSPDDLGHYRCFVMDSASADTLFFLTCR